MSTETPCRIEPCLIEDYPAALADLIAVTERPWIRVVCNLYE